MQALADAIAATSWVQTPSWRSFPISRRRARWTARLTDILWLDCKLFVSPLSRAKLAKAGLEEIGRSLNADIRAALAYAFERSPGTSEEYLEENFTLAL